MDNPITRIDHLDREEAWDFVRLLRPDMSREAFNQVYDEFEAEKAERIKKQALN